MRLVSRLHGLRLRLGEHRPVAPLNLAPEWPKGHEAALSFSFDDGRPSQLRHGLPALRDLGVPATFFVLPHEVEPTRSEWRTALTSGHEIGNHTMTHPCSENFAWSRENGLERMTVADFQSEISEANRQLHRLLGMEPTVFAYPCGQTFVGRGRDTHSLVPLIAEMFDAGRTFNDVVANAPLHVDQAQVACFNSDGHTFEALLPTLEAALADGAWLVLGGHEIGPNMEGGGPGDITLVDTIERVVGWARSHNVWIDTIGNIARASSVLQAKPSAITLAPSPSTL